MQFVRVWVVLLVVTAGLETGTRTSYQRVVLAAILLLALVLGVVTIRRVGIERGPLTGRARPLPRGARPRLTAAAFIPTALVLVIGEAGRFAVVPDSGRGSFLAGMAGFVAGVAVAYPVIWLYLIRRFDRRNTNNTG